VDRGPDAGDGRAGPGPGEGILRAAFHRVRDAAREAESVAPRAEAEFVAATPYTGQRSDTVVLYCADSRFRPQTHEFLTQHLGLGSVLTVTIPGGPSPVLPLVGLAHKLVKGWLDELVDVAHVKRVVLVGHEDCAAYLKTNGKVLNFVLRAFSRPSVRELQVKHLREARGSFAVWFPGVAVECWYAEVRPAEDGSGQRVAFVRVE
jgi:hypothetical protein